ncbi:hypothetical protein HY031_01685 [Candidatus Gottesmanbacteria bacterium]|nr:hypothetical protein [Candidatus Gottesmanbacteria bacterium]
MPSFLVHFFLPHASNNHRPKALHIDTLFVYILLFILLHFAVRTVNRTFPDILGYATDIHLQQLLDDTNQKRQAAGLSPLVLNGELSAAAAQKAVDMFAKNYWAHVGPDGETPWDFIVNAGYRYTVAGENLAKNFSTSQSVVDAWMASPSHRENLLKSSYRDVGFAVVNGTLNGEETTLVVQMFGATAARPVSVVPPKPVEVSVQASQTQAAEVQPVVAAPPPQTVSSAYAAVSQKPLINIPTMSRDVSYVFIGIVMSVLAIDAWLVARRRTVRFAGHNIAHLFFLAALLVATTLVERGRLI